MFRYVALSDSMQVVSLLILIDVVIFGAMDEADDVRIVTDCTAVT